MSARSIYGSCFAPAKPKPVIVGAGCGGNTEQHHPIGGALKGQLEYSQNKYSFMPAKLSSFISTQNFRCSVKNMK